MKRECGNCEFYEEFDSELGLGSCCRFPSVFVGVKHSSDEDAWDHPTVNAVNWCGEFKDQAVEAEGGSANKLRR